VEYYPLCALTFYIDDKKIRPWSKLLITFIGTKEGINERSSISLTENNEKELM